MSQKVGIEFSPSEQPVDFLKALKEKAPGKAHIDYTNGVGRAGIFPGRDWDLHIEERGIFGMKEKLMVVGLARKRTPFLEFGYYIDESGVLGAFILGDEAKEEMPVPLSLLIDNFNVPFRNAIRVAQFAEEFVKTHIVGTP